eukprot:m.174394 g.174394  ORF g.174394 m.174394 type:complete len:444 (+) comp18328_c0_seq5:71-1402(+)
MIAPFFVACALLSSTAAVLDDAVTPPMGWRSWNCMLNDISQIRIEQQIDAIVAHIGGDNVSLASLGYNRIGIDGGWVCSGPASDEPCVCGGVNGSYHNSAGNPVISSARFPNMSALAAHAHVKGVRLDWYGNSCNCAKQEWQMWGKASANGGNVASDVATLTSIGFDGIKVDGCGPAHDIAAWVRALAAADGRPLLLENCGDNTDGQKTGPWTWSVPRPQDVSGDGPCGFHMYRVSTDIAPQFVSTMYNLQQMIPFLPHSRPSCWAYPDMLQVGNARLSDTEARTHFAAWCITSSPLVLGHDLTDAASTARATLIVSNTRAIAINQAWYNRSAGYVLWTSLELFNASAEAGARGNRMHTVTLPKEQVWAKVLTATETAILAINLWNQTAHNGIAVDLTVLPGIVGAARLTDVWSGASRVVHAATFRTAVLPPHASDFFVVSPA